MTTKKDIESTLMRGADTLRDTIDAANYKDYVLPMMFVKYLSDSYTDAVGKLLIVIRLDLPHRRIHQLPDIVSKALLIQIIE